MTEINSAEDRGSQIERWMLLGLLLLTVLVRAPVAARNTSSLYHDVDGYTGLATNLRWRFTYQLSDVGLPTAQRPPLYPLLLTAVVDRDGGNLPAIAALHVLLGIGTVLLVVQLGQEWGLGRWRFLAGALVACDPILLKQSTVLMTETLATFLAALALLALTAAANRRGLLRAALAGAALGLTVLCRPAFLVWALAAPMALWWILPRTVHRFRLVATTCAAMAAVIAPWGVRNAIQFGRPIITTTHGGFTLRLANNSEYYEHLQSTPYEPWYADDFNENFGPWMVDRGFRSEIEWDRNSYQAAWTTIKAQPGMFAWASLYRVSRLWGMLPLALEGQGPRQELLRYATAGWYTFVFALAVVGLWSVGRGLVTTPWLFGLLLAVSFTCVHAVYWTDMRMRAPLAPGVCLAAAAGAGWIWVRLARRNQRSHKQLQGGP